MGRLLVDGDALVYRCGFAGEKTHYLVEGLTGEAPEYDKFTSSKEAKECEARHEDAVIWTRKSIDPVENVLHSVKNILNKVKNRFDGAYEDVVVYLAGVGNYRHGLATRAKYKGNRDHLPRPVAYDDIRNYLINHWHAVLVDGQEVDDILGIEAKPEDILVHQDKDINQVEGKHYNPFGGGNYYTVTKPQGYKFFLEQCLTGDQTDNIPGIEGVGEVTAKKILNGVKGPKDGWQRVVKAYNDYLGGKGSTSPVDLALETARLVWIRRKPNEIWSPPS